MTDTTPSTSYVPLDLAPIEARHAATSHGSWEAHPHAHPASGCRCLSCYEEPTGWLIDHPQAVYCDDVVAGRKSDGETNGFGRELDSCTEGPLLSYEDAIFAAHAYDDVPALIAEVKHLRAVLAVRHDHNLWLSALEAAGVDNWEGYSHASDLYEQFKSEETDGE